MNRSTVWPDFRDCRVVFDDGDILVVDKAEGTPSQSADPERPDDLVTRLRAHLGGIPLGVHQRLDQDTSGLLVFARRREANAGLAAQFEGHTVRKTYVACVTGWPAGRKNARLVDAIERGEGKSMRVTRDVGRAKRAATRVKVLARVADRTMLELELETGRTHQARVQLAHAGAPIAGDSLYGGAPAPRLLLHASALAFEHPLSRRAVPFSSAPPEDFGLWLERGDLGSGIYDEDGALERALGRAVERRWGLGRSEGARATNAFRLVDEDGDGLPRLVVDVYGDWLVAQFYGEDGPWASPERRDRVLDRLHGLGFDGVYLKVRPKQANTLSRRPETERARHAPAQPVRGSAAPPEFAVLEEGIGYLVRLGDGLSTGLFLDQRQNRRRVREGVAGKSLANLFAYTCGFTVAAALGGASRTVSVDASVSALERGRANLLHAGVELDASGKKHALVADDVFAWLDRAARRGETFDLVVLDPPSYSTTKRGRFVAQSDYGDLAAAALRVLAPAGRVLACTNHRGVSRSQFRRTLFDAARAAARHVVQMKDVAPPSDFRSSLSGEPHLKSAWVSFE